MMKNQKGQVAIIVLLISAVVMTIGLSVSKRTVVETKIDSDEEQLKQAFNAAESGIENYMKNKEVSYLSSDNSSASVTTSNVGGNSATLNFGGVALANSTNYYWLVGHDLTTGLIDTGVKYTGTTLNICIDPAFRGALKVDYYYQNGGNYYVWRQGYNVVNTTVNGYSVINPGTGSCPVGWWDVPMDNVPLAGNTPLLVAVKPIGFATKMAMLGNANFPVQGEEITSTGTVGNDISQVVKIFNQYQVPVFMLDSITAAGNVTY